MHSGIKIITIDVQHKPVFCVGVEESKGPNCVLCGKSFKSHFIYRNNKNT